MRIYIKKRFRFHITALLLWFIISTVFSCKQNQGNEELSEQGKEVQKERFIAGGRLEKMLENKNLELSLLYLNFLHVKYPHDPQFYFCEGWVYDMKKDSVKSHAAYSKALNIYDSLIVVEPKFDREINRAVIVQILYGQKAYTKTLDNIQAKYNTYNDSLEIEMVWRKFVYNPNEFFQGASHTSSVD